MRDEQYAEYEPAIEHARRAATKGGPPGRGGTPAPTLAELPRAEFRKLLRGRDPAARAALLAARLDASERNRDRALQAQIRANRDRAS